MSWVELDSGWVEITPAGREHVKQPHRSAQAPEQPEPRRGVTDDELDEWLIARAMQG